MQNASLVTDTRRCFAACTLAVATLFACEPKTYPEAAPDMTVVFEANPDPAGIVEVTADAGSVARSSDAGPAQPGVSASDSDETDRAVAGDAGCTPVPLFRDRDGDGFGSNDPQDVIEGCPPRSGYALEGGDCHDAQPRMVDPARDVFPGQALFFTVGYPGPNGVSFDYDCSGREEADPGPAFVAAPTDCEQRAVTSCVPQTRGYIPLVDERSGTGANPLCGVRERGVCATVGLDCALTRISAGDPFPCH